VSAPPLRHPEATSPERVTSGTLALPPTGTGDFLERRRTLRDFIEPGRSDVPSHLPRTVGATDAGSEATKHLTCQRVGVSWTVPFGFFVLLLVFFDEHKPS
jgi:hypothetical protein